MSINPNKMFKQVRQMQSQMMEIQDKLGAETVEAQVGGGMVSATFSGQGDMVSVKIDPEVINSDDKEMLEDLIVSAVNKGLEKSRDLMTERMSSITGGLSGALGSMGMGF